MAKYVPDIMSRRWVIISSNRADRPHDFDDPESRKKPCPFCPGREAHSEEERYVIKSEQGDKTTWNVRVVANKYPITDFHEVVIHTPDHHADLHEMSKSHAANVFQAYRQRYNAYRDKGQVFIFCNRGERAGASLDHPHSQLVVIPFQINLDTLRREPLGNLVEENNYFNIYCPDFSQWPYEVWLAPKKENTCFGDINDDEIEDLVEIYQKVMKRLEEVYEREYRCPDGFSYNFYIHPKENWYIRIIPRFVHRAGFEVGTGLSVNVTDPRDAAQALRSKDEEVRLLEEKLKELKNK